MNAGDFDWDGHTYRFTKLKLSEAKETLELLTEAGFFDDLGFTTFTKDASLTNRLQRKLFGEHVMLLNDEGDFVPLGPAVADQHFSGRVGAYFKILLEAVRFNFEDFLGGNWIADDQNEIDPE